MSGALLIGLAALAAAAGLAILAEETIHRRRAGRDRIEALIDATREKNPQYADWDTRELTS